MIITCEQCQTRFKVPDQKLEAGPVRMRCSKCNHVFTAGAEGTPTPQPMAAVGPTPAAAPAPSAPALFRAPTPRPSVTQPMYAFGGTPGTPTPGQAIGTPGQTLGMPRVDPFAPSSNAGQAVPRTTSRTGIDPFAPVKATAPQPTKAPSADPFASMAMRSSPMPDPFAAKPTVDPFAPAPTKTGVDPFAPGPRPATDPFAALGKPPPPADPFAGVMSDQFPAPSRVDPFAAKPTTTGPDPFAAKPTSTGHDPFAPKPTATGPDPFGFGATSTGTGSDPFGVKKATPPVDPFAPKATDPFAVLGGPKAPDLSPSQPTQAMVDPFGGSPPASSPSFSSPPTSDPFAGLSVGPSASPSSPPAVPAPPPDEDPFAGIGDDVEANRSLFDSGGGNLSESSQPGLTTTPFSSSPPGPARAPPAPAERSAPVPVAKAAALAPAAPGRAAPALRAAAAFVQVVLFVAFLVVAVVLGRGGSIDRLLALDLLGALAGDDVARPLPVEELRVTQRRYPSERGGGVDVVVVAGVVVHNGDAQHTGLRVEATFEDGTKGTGWVNSELTALAVADAFAAGVKPEDALAALAARKPTKSTPLSPGDRAPFVIVARAPAEGSHVVVVAVPE
ncbi:MAG: zinc-ribbon domain-containing protein [Deltaproteobacteria bacterium]|nr:zinc-ribbon domain-containing protein [Deltaproteobacteria bacterium]